MPSSYEIVNYSLRPAKNIERKMFCEVFRRLVEFEKLESYRYVGFGSTFFKDFSLFHKSLGIGNSISMEKDEAKHERFEFNKPFDCITLRFGNSKEILPTLDWAVKTIIWLDYDYGLTDGILGDVAFVTNNAPAGSVLIVSVNSRPEEYGKRVDSLKLNIEGKKIPAPINEKILAKWGTAKVYREIITNEIAEKLAVRNGTRTPGTEFVYTQLFNFHYKDGVEMLTVGGLIYDKNQESLVDKCSFESFEFVRTDEQPYSIEVPSLTLKEMHHLDRQLPCCNIENMDKLSIPKRDVEKYAKLYRYFPSYVDADTT